MYKNIAKVLSETYLHLSLSVILPEQMIARAIFTEKTLTFPISSLKKKKYTYRFYKSKTKRGDKNKKNLHVCNMNFV